MPQFMILFADIGSERHMGVSRLGRPLTREDSSTCPLSTWLILSGMLGKNRGGGEQEGFMGTRGCDIPQRVGRSLG